MSDNLEQLYQSFLKGELPFQKDLGVFQLEKLIVLTGTTWAWKSTLIQELNLPHLISYKTGDTEVEVRPGQLYITPEKFAKKLEKWDFFDVYKLGSKYYAYALRDYFVVAKEYGKVFIDVSLENLTRGIKYVPKQIAILVPTEEQLASNLQKRVIERWYSQEKSREVIERQLFENSLISDIREKYWNLYIFTTFSEFMN